MILCKKLAHEKWKIIEGMCAHKSEALSFQFRKLLKECMVRNQECIVSQPMILCKSHSVQITSIREAKENNILWFAAVEIAISAWGRIGYLTRKKKAHDSTQKGYDTWHLKDSQVRN